MLFDVLKTRTQEHPQKIAVKFNGDDISYSQLLHNVQILVHALYAEGVRAGDAVAVLTESRPEFIETFFALARLNVAMIPVNTSYHKREIVEIFNVCDVRWVICDRNNHGTSSAAANVASIRPVLIKIDSDSDDEFTLNKIIDRHSLEGDIHLDLSEIPSAGDDDDFIVLFSSGSTGRPKRMTRSQSSYLLEMQGFLQLTRTTHDDNILCVIPLYHSHGIGSCLLPAFGSGASLILLDSQPDKKTDTLPKDLFVQKLGTVFDLIESEEITLIPAIPYIFQAIFDYPRVSKSLFHRVRLCFSSGNFLSPDLYRKFHQRFGVTIHQIYGCSEAGAVSIDTGSVFDDELTHLPSGVALPGTEIKVVSQNGRKCRIGKVGEILVKSPSLTKGYVDFPDLTKQVFKAGYFYTGDLGRIGKDGVLTLTGRKKLLIDTGGKKVDPFEIQDVIAEIPSVNEVIVLGVPATAGNEWIKAVVATSSGINKELVIEHCKQRLAHYKVPRIVEFRETIPKSATGKILLKDMINEDDVAQITREFLHDLIERSINPETGVDGDLTFDEMGIDSVVMAELNKALEEYYDFLPKTLFFEYRTLRELAEYLNTHHRDKLRSADAALNMAVTSDIKVVPAELNGKDSVPSSRDIAIIGMAGQYPGAKNLREFWGNLVTGKDCITEIPKDRWDWSRFFDADPAVKGKSYTKWGGFIDDVYEFDTSIFTIPPVEAETIDPQERLFLASVWRTLEDAGYARDDFLNPEDREFNNVGVYVGVMWGDYQLFSMNRSTQVEDDGNLTKSHYWSIPNRVSYFFNFNGPSMAVDTACSSSLTAVHAACQAINSGECEWAIAGGVNLILHPRRYQLMALGKYASTDGRCRSFGEGGDGYVPAEGVGSVLLKPLDKAIRDNDNIYAVIKGSALNHGGNSKAYTVPDPHAQKAVIHKALENANVDPETLTYVEAHGTGTMLGDPIEVRGLSLAFEQSVGAKQGSCAIGSVKSNIGHAEAAAGIAGVTKVALQMRHKTLVPSLHAQSVNPNIDFAKTPFYLQQDCSEWLPHGSDSVSSDISLRAGLSSFGAGGSNVHVIFESYEAKPQSAAAGEGNEQLFLLSAINQERLAEYANVWVDAIGGEGNAITFMGSLNVPALCDVAYTLQSGRTLMPHRLVVIASGWKELRRALDSFANGAEAKNLFVGDASPTREGDAAEFVMPEDAAARPGLQSLAGQWVSGVDIPWKQIFGDGVCNKVSLPGYPFSRTSYCVPLPEFGGRQVSALEDGRSSTGAVAPSVNCSSDVERVVLSKAWRKAERASRPLSLDGVVITLGTVSTQKISDSLFAGMSSVHTLNVVHKGKGSSDVLSVDYYSPESGDELYAQIKDRLGTTRIAGVIDLSAMDRRYEQSSEVELGKIRILQNIVESDRTGSLFLLQLTYRLADNYIKNPGLQGARMAGLYRMLGAEYRQIKSLVLDTDCQLSYHNKLTQQIESEVSNIESLTTTECCYRKNARYEPYLEKRAVNQHSIERAVDKHVYGKDDVVLISGGTGGLGLVMASRLAQRGIRKMVLLGREKLPEACEWRSAVAGNPDTRMTTKLMSLIQLADMGVDLHYSNVSLTDRAGLKRLVKDVAKRLGKITGVYHCAGMASDMPVFFKKDIHEIEAVCSPKIKGLVNLCDALELNTLRFFTLFSSISALLPSLGAGQSDYALANSYMDSFVTNMIGKGHDCFQSIQWSAWGDTGMSASEEARTPLYRALGFNYLSNEEALDLLEYVSQQPDGVVSPCVVDSSRLATENLLDAVSVVEAQAIDTRKYVVLNDERVSAGNVEVIKEWLYEIFSAELKIPIEQLDELKLFSDYGIESVLLAQLTQSIQKKLGVTLSPSLLLEYGSINELVEYFSTEHAEQFNIEAVPAGGVASAGNAMPIGKVSAEPKGLDDDAIAVVGISCRFPGAENKELFWNNLLQGRSSIRPVSEERWKSDNDRVDYGGFVDGIEMFDPEFFKVNEKDAAVMDPQARLLLEESLAAIYDAGYELGDTSGENVGVYIGGRAESPTSFRSVLSAPNPILGIGQNYLATNISRFFNFSGPSMVLDTACSSGIMALQLASDALKSARINTALVGTASLLVNSHAHDMFDARNILSADGEFHIFDKRSGGEVLGEGVGVVVLKRLGDAISDGNKIYGVVKAISINNDGQTLGPGSPNINAQKSVMENALSMAGITADDVGYIEVNGGGTPVVDSVEIRALSDVYALADESRASCCIGSVKPNVGHLLLSSGMAGFIRCVLSVHNKTIPPYLSTKEPFDFYDFKKSRITMNRSAVEWESNAGRPRFAAQNCFPDGGTNCHILIEEYVPLAVYSQRYFEKPVPALDKRRFPHDAENMKLTSSTTINVEAMKFENVWGQYEESL